MAYLLTKKKEKNQLSWDECALHLLTVALNKENKK